MNNQKLKEELYTLIKSDISIFDFLSDAVLDGLWFWDLKDREQGWTSPRFWRLLGFTEEEAIAFQGKWDRFLFPEDLEKAHQLYERHMADSSVPYDMILRFNHREGHELWVHNRGKVIKDEEGKPWRMIGVHTDVTALKEAEIELRNSNEILRGVLDSQAYYIITTDLEGRYTYVNDYYCEAFGLDHTKGVIGQEGLDHIIPDDHHKCREVVNQCLARPNIPFSIELRKPGHDGSMVFTSWEFTAISGKKGAPNEILCIGYDITEKVQTEQFFKVLVNTLSDVVTIVNYKGIIQYASPAWASHYGFSREAMIGRHFSEFSCPITYKLVPAFLKSLLEGTTNSNLLEHCFYHSEEEKYWVETNATLDIDNQQIILVSRDIAARKAAEAEIEEMTALLNKTEKLAKVGGWKLDLSINIPVWTDGCYDIHELENRQTHDIEWALSFYPPEDRQLIQDSLEEAVKKRERFDISCRFITAKGNKRWVRVTGHPVEQEGEVKAILGLIMDVTEHKEAEMALQRQTAMQQIIMNISSKYINLPLEEVDDGINRSLKEIGCFFGAERAYVFRYNRSEDTASNIYEWCAEGISPQIENLQNIPNSMMKEWVEQHYRGETIHIPDVQSLPEGQTREMLEPQGVQSLLTVPMMRKGECQGFVGFDMVKNQHHFSEEEQALLQLFAELLVNVQIRSRAQQRLEESRAQLQKLTENVPGAIYRFERSPDGAYSFPFISKGVSKLVPGSTPEKVINDADVLFRHIPREDLPRIIEAIEYSAEHLSIFSEEYKIVLDDDSLHWHKATSRPERKADGTVVWYGIFQDVTREKEIEAIKARAQELEAKNKEMEQFAYVASHDLREPLRTVQSYVSLLERKLKGQLDEQTQQYIGYVKEASSRMTHLITGLLEYSQLGRDMTQKQINCKCLLEEVKLDLASSIAAKKASIEFGPLPVKIVGYELELRLLFQNLISNAIKFGKKEVPPQVKVSGKALPDGWQFEITDNGIGVSAEYQDKIFDIFERLHHQSEFEGTGIGLANCKKIVDMHLGRIWLESELGKGTTFYFTIKAMKEA